MASLGTVMLNGASGAEYTFDVYTADTIWLDDIACVYYISNVGNDGRQTSIYIGETEDLKERISPHHKQSCFHRYRYNAISIYQEGLQSRRLEIESDLVQHYSPPCND